MLRRRFMATVPVACLPALACAIGGNGPREAAPRTLDKAQKDELTWLVWSSDATTRKEAYDAMSKRITDQFPSVTVTRIAGGSETFEKLITMMASDTRVDVVGTRPDYLASYAEGPNPLKPLRDFLKQDTYIKESDHIEGAISGLSWKGILYALPVGVYTNNLCLNLDLFQRSGITLPKADWTIDEAIEMARRMTVRSPEGENASTWGFFQDWAAVLHFPYTWIRGNGGEPLVPNDPPTKSQWATDAETVKTMQWLVDLSHRTAVSPVDRAGGTTGAFIQGRVAINVNETNNLYGIGNSIAAGSVPIRWDVHPLPVMKKGRYHPIGAFAYGLSRNTKNPDLAFELLKEIIGPRGQTDWFRLAKFAPSIKSLLNGAYLEDKDPPASKRVIVDSLNAAKPMPKTPRYVELGAISLEVFTNLRAGKITVNEATADLDRRMGQLLTAR
jgi:ABC-type glycerol-3-phosphate transport system substrate-binding protein